MMNDSAFYMNSNHNNTNTNMDETGEASIRSNFYSGAAYTTTSSNHGLKKKVIAQIS